MADWYLIKNDRGAICDPKKGGCGKVHEYLTHQCRPVAFDHPWEWSFFSPKVVEDRAITLKTQELTYSSSPLGTVVIISEKDAEDLNIIRNPPSNPVVVAKSFPNAATRRSGGTQAPSGRISRTRWR